ncbi:MAG TPA: CBS domain-containing protein [Bryobacteraceae bacterium]|nr:CBS domain-containing protein [Bryobacteraceae bacterium]
MKVREVMTKDTASCGLDASLASAVETMQKFNCGFLPVIGEGGNVIGVITDRDICIALGQRDQKPSEVLVRDLVLPKDRTFPRLYVCTPDDNVRCLLKSMRAQKIRRLPVVDREGALQGIVSIDDLVLRACEQAGPEGVSRKEVVETFKAIRRRVPDWPVAA